MNKGQFPESNKTISGIDLPKTDQDDVQYVDFAGILSNCETTDNTIRLLASLLSDALGVTAV